MKNDIIINMKFKQLLIPKSNERLENSFKWRLFKVIYFLFAVVSGSIYSLINSWHYINCPFPSNNLPWAEEKLLCTKLFAWDELLGTIIVLLIIFRILFPLVEKTIIYVIFRDTKH